ncbi:MAG: hypothetical protein M3R63_05605 [Actinomycetota bacterium]|nr:hypothetical protein [Actinomycetota bacterium]
MTTSSTPGPISPDLGGLLALRRVHRGHVVLVGHDLLIDHGRPVPDYLRAPVHELLDDGHLYLGEERPEWRQRPVLATVSGEQLHTKLEELAHESVAHGCGGSRHHPIRLLLASLASSDCLRMDRAQLERKTMDETVVEKTWQIAAHGEKGPVTIKIRMPEVSSPTRRAGRS